MRIYMIGVLLQNRRRSQPNSLASSSYGAEPAQNPDASGKSTESTT